jgi:hypothetical protein
VATTPEKTRAAEIGGSNFLILQYTREDSNL